MEQGHQSDNNPNRDISNRLLAIVAFAGLSFGGGVLARTYTHKAEKILNQENDYALVAPSGFTDVRPSNNGSPRVVDQNLVDQKVSNLDARRTLDTEIASVGAIGAIVCAGMAGVEVVMLRREL